MASELIERLVAMNLVYIKGSTQNVHYTCSCGADHTASLSNITQQFKTGQGKCCPKCRTRKSTKLTIAEVETTCAAHGMQYVSGYKDADTKFLVQCVCGRDYLTWLGNVRKGQTCAVCSGRAKYTTEQMQDILTALNIELLSEYTGALQPMQYICECGGIGNSTWANLQVGKRCGHCAENNWRAKFAEFGAEILEYASPKKITYRCSCGNINTTSADWWIVNNDCPTCHVHGNFKLNKVPVVRPSLNRWKREVLERDGYECANCSCSEELHVHHIEAWSTAPELGTEVTNGITLCGTCHRDLHSLYGYNVGLLNLEEALGCTMTSVN